MKRELTTMLFLVGSFILRLNGGFRLLTLFRKCSFNASCDTGPLNLSHNLTRSDKLTDINIF